MIKIVFFVPVEHKEAVKAAVFDAGAGRIGNYDQCSWEVEGVGQFRPLAGAMPYLGNVGQLETSREFKVEMVCEDKLLSEVLKALKQAHPYEEPAYEFVRLLDPEAL
ncbi:MAG: NGG1p interacting factor NIF3 [Moraxellaceae bacterium]|nr:MAG: NGG1p interacting factor NIF3 [Moraxellaceae bacterium]